jgi:hypothetical protein
MKKFFTTSFIVLCFVVGISSPLQNSFICPASQLKNDLKPMLKPDYKYDSSKTTRIALSGEKQIKEIEVPLFIGEKYKFVFNAAELPNDVNIVIYDKKIGKKNREVLYSNEKEKKAGKKTFVYEPDKSRTMYINYDIPASKEGESGCIVFLLGYRI